MSTRVLLKRNKDVNNLVGASINETLEFIYLRAIYLHLAYLKDFFLLIHGKE